MNVTTFPLTKDERYRIARLARQVRGLYRAEKQALAFIAETQTMQNGVCSKALTSGEDFGYHRKSIQRGLHGRQRNGKTEYPGLLARGIVYLTGGYPKGGRAPGGDGLTPAYVINLEVLMTFIPERDVAEQPKPPEPEVAKKKVDPLVDPNMDPLEKNVDPYVDHGSNKFSSSSLGASHLDDERATGVDFNEPSETSSDKGEVPRENLVVVDGREAPKNHRVIGPNDSSSSAPPTPPFLKTSSVAVVGSDLVESSGEEEKTNTKTTGTKTTGRGNQPRSEAEIIARFEMVFNRVKDETGKRWADRQIQRDIELDSDAVFRTTARQCKEVVEFCRALGNEKALAMWEDFLVGVNHAVNTSDNSPQRTWYLKDFVGWADRQLRRENVVRQSKMDVATTGLSVNGCPEE
jgi:hypothetical protein